MPPKLVTLSVYVENRLALESHTQRQKSRHGDTRQLRSKWNMEQLPRNTLHHVMLALQFPKRMVKKHMHEKSEQFPRKAAILFVSIAVPK